MHRCADVCKDAGAGAEIVDGNRQLANLLRTAADRIEELEARLDRRSEDEEER
jgi:hypothetical protein